MTTHELKIWPDYFAAILDGSKTFELRRNDRNYMEGDTLRLREYNIDELGHEGYTGREITRRVGWMTGVDEWIENDVSTFEYVVMSLLPLDSAQ